MSRKLISECLTEIPEELVKYPFNMIDRILELPALTVSEIKMIHGILALFSKPENKDQDCIKLSWKEYIKYCTSTSQIKDRHYNTKRVSNLIQVLSNKVDIYDFFIVNNIKYVRLFAEKPNNSENTSEIELKPPIYFYKNIPFEFINKYANKKPYILRTYLFLYNQRKKRKSKTEGYYEATVMLGIFLLKILGCNTYTRSKKELKEIIDSILTDLSFMKITVELRNSKYIYLKWKYSDLPKNRLKELSNENSC